MLPYQCSHLYPPSYFSHSYLEGLYVTVIFTLGRNVAEFLLIVVYSFMLLIHLGQLDLCCSECGSWTRSISILWELVRNAESQALLYTSCVRICVLMRFPGDVSIP